MHRGLESGNPKNFANQKQREEKRKVKEGEKRAEVVSGGKRQAQLSGGAKDTVTRHTVMILVTNHTYKPPTEILSAFSPLFRPPPPASCVIIIIVVNQRSSGKRPGHVSRQTSPASVHHKAGQTLHKALQAFVSEL